MSKHDSKQQLAAPKKKQEKLSRKDIGDLMGIHRDIYERRNGAIRKK